MQTYRIDDHPSYASQVDVGTDAAGVDMLIGELAYAHRGLGAPLLRQIQAWARSKGSRELASDAEVDNAISSRAHVDLGFDEVQRVDEMR